jgi:hypothetical protein
MLRPFAILASMLCAAAPAWAQSYYTERLVDPKAGGTAARCSSRRAVHC